jgi:hypothetical protein
MLKADFPLVKSEGGRASWYLPVWNEVFLGFAPNYGARSFDQNRFFVGVGKSIPWSSNLEVGYMKHVIGQRNGRIFEWNNTLSVTWSSTYDLSSLWN